MTLRLQQKLAPHFTYCAILTTLEPKNTYSLDSFELMLDAIYPAPEGVIVCGSFSEEEGEKMRSLVSLRRDEDGEPMKFVKVPSGTPEQGGAEGMVEIARGLLRDAFHVEWTVYNAGTAEAKL